MLEGIKGKGALVTGASGGIGLAWRVCFLSMERLLGFVTINLQAKPTRFSMI